ncbi:MAG TPA: hypothetical protein VKR31_03990 [Rhizomicrobium sp.]|nr:hypothetical protein [Rhizomicrobium sp.]
MIVTPGDWFVVPARTDAKLLRMHRATKVTDVRVFFDKTDGREHSSSFTFPNRVVFAGSFEDCEKLVHSWNLIRATEIEAEARLTKNFNCLRDIALGSAAREHRNVAELARAAGP